MNIEMPRKTLDLSSAIAEGDIRVLLIWTHPGMTTYYRNSQGRVFSAMPWRFVDYWTMTHDPDFSQYRQAKA